jgi:hypothetical protein
MDTITHSVQFYLQSESVGPCPASIDTMISNFMFPPAGSGTVGNGTTLCGNSDGILVVSNVQIGINYVALFGTKNLDSQHAVSGSVSLTIPNSNLNSGWNTINVRAINTCGTVDLSPNVLFKKGISGPVAISVTSTSLCTASGSPVQLMAGPASKYQWYWNTSYLVGDTLANMFPLIPGDYHVIAFDSLNCPGVLSNTITITSQLPTPVISIQSAGSNFMDLGSSSYSNMQWYGNGKAIFGSNTNNLRVYYNGEYFVSYIQNGCRQVSAPFVVNNPNYDLLAKKNFLSNDSIIFIEPPLEVNDLMWIFPNPAKDNFTLAYIGSSNESILVDIIGPLGEKVYHESVRIHPGTNELKFEGLNLNDGLYQVILLDGDKKLVKAIQVTK